MDTFGRNGLVFDVLDTGPSDGPIVVLLHGFPQFNTSWSKVSSILNAEGYRCLAPNNRGYPPGARPRGRRAYRMPELVEDIAALIDAAGGRKVHLVGHDWGAAIAWGFAAEHPESLASFTALSVPHPAAFLRAMVTSRQLLASWYMYAFQLPAIPERLLSSRDGARLKRSLLQTNQSAAAAERDTRAMIESGALPTALNMYRALFLTDPRTANVKVSAPTLYIWSDGDTALLRKGAENCGKWVTGPYRFENLSGVSHWIPDEVPERAAALLLEHFAAHPA
jgi:pimeloyl-ACP methyl ester carboxylesterase